MCVCVCFGVEDIPLCMKYNDKIKLYTYSVGHNNIFITLMATIFGHNGHYQAKVPQKLNKAGAYDAKSLIYMGPHLHLC